MKQKNILFLKGRSRYDALPRYIDEMAAVFRKEGYHTLIIDARLRQWKYQLNMAIQKYDFEAVVTCNGMYLDTEQVRKIGKKFFTYMFDHPIWHDQRLNAADSDSIIFHCDKSESDYINKYYPNVGRSVFIPLSGSFCVDHIPYKDRTYEIVFTGSYIKPEVMYEQICQTYTGSVQILVKDFIKKLKEYPDKTYENALKETFEDYGQGDIEGTEFRDLAVEFRDVDQYIRFYFRDRIIRQIVESDIKIHIYGEGWEDFESDYKDNLILEKGNWYIAQKAIANAKISLNIMPWFKTGFQERIATALLSGTIALTDSSEYIQENFKDMENIALYDLKELEALPEKIKFLLSHEDIASEIAQNGQEMAMQNHTWEDRTKKIVQIVKEELNDFSESAEDGCELSAALEETRSQMVALDVLDELYEIEKLLDNLQICTTIRADDYRYCVDRLLRAADMFVLNFPNFNTGSYVWKLITVQRQDVPSYMSEMIRMQVAYLERGILQMENDNMKIENQNLSQRLNENIIQLTKEHEENKDLLIERFIRKYKNDTSPDIQELLTYIQEERDVQSYNYPFVKEYLQMDLNSFVEVFYDKDAGMHYVLYKNKRMYYPKGYDELNIKVGYRFISIEQDLRSPHRYLDEKFDVHDGDVVIDGGVAEGNFSLEVVERVKKLYLIECDDLWIEALKKTFEPWKEKVVIIKKMLGYLDDETHISVDALVGDEEVNFIKMDVEGAENTLKKNKKIQCAICSYHRKNDEIAIKKILEESGFQTSTTARYMYYRDDKDAVIDLELRRGIVRGTKMLI